MQRLGLLGHPCWRILSWGSVFGLSVLHFVKLNMWLTAPRSKNWLPLMDILDIIVMKSAVTWELIRILRYLKDLKDHKTSKSSYSHITMKQWLYMITMKTFNFWCITLKSKASLCPRRYMCTQYAKGCLHYKRWPARKNALFCNILIQSREMQA